MTMILVQCSHCRKSFQKELRRVRENAKFRHKSYCSLGCFVAHRKKRRILVCENPSCGCSFERVVGRLSRHNYCSQRCAAIVNNSKHPKHPGVVKKCFVCGKDFVSLEKYCSVGCKNKGRIIGKDKIILSIKEFYKSRGRIPLKREFRNYNAARNRFGTWNKAIKAAGFDPNPVMFAKKYVANDGHKCDSLAEKIIDDFLFAREVKHERGVSYPTDHGFTVDFKIGDFWIEFFGLSGEHRRYDELKRRKLQIAKKFDLNLIEIYPRDLFPKSRLSEILSMLV